MNPSATPSDTTILSELAYALTDHSTFELGSRHFVDLTDGGLFFIESEYMREKITPEQLAKYHDWEQYLIRTYMEHDLIAIDPLPSYESFHIMEDFIVTRPSHEQQHLVKALNRKHPFSCFKYAVEDLGILQEWYDFKNEAEVCMAEKWLKVEGLTITEGKIVRR